MAERERADLLVVGSAHRGAVGRVLGGDVALGSLHGSPCPVAVAPRGMADHDAAPLRRIGVGFDGTQESRQALALAVALATSARVQLELLCAATAPIPLFAEAAWSDGAIVDNRLEAEELVGRTLAALDVDAVGKAVVGGPVETLVEFTHRVDLLVVGSRGWGRVQRMLFGQHRREVDPRGRLPGAGASPRCRDRRTGRAAGHGGNRAANARMSGLSDCWPDAARQ